MLNLLDLEPDGVVLTYVFLILQCIKTFTMSPYLLTHYERITKFQSTSFVVFKNQDDIFKGNNKCT